MYKSTYHSKQELVDTLEKRGMNVSNPNILDEINYSHLIYKYGEYFLEVETLGEIRYKEGTDIVNLYNLFDFNNQLSTKLMYIFSKIEHKLRSSIVGHISIDNPLAYLDPSFYSDAFSEEDRISFIETLKKTEEAKRHKYNEKHFLNGVLPIWLLIDELPIGQLRMFLKLGVGIQKKVFKDMNIEPRKWWIIKIFNQYRNLSAHMDIIKGNISIDGKVNLKPLLVYIKNNYGEDYRDVTIFLAEYSFDNINLDKSEYIKKLGF